MDALKASGIRNITVARGYMKESLQGDFECVDNPRWSESNMVRTLLTSMRKVRERPCIVAYSDIVYHPDHIRALGKSEAAIAILFDRKWRDLWEARFENPLDDAETFRMSGGKLAEIGLPARSMEDIEGQFMGLLQFSPEGFALVEASLAGLDERTIDKMDTTGLLQHLLDEGMEIETIPIEGKWCECDSMDDVRTYTEAISRAEHAGKAWSHDWRAIS
jgi:choline kinase